MRPSGLLLKKSPSIDSTSTSFYSTKQVSVNFSELQIQQLKDESPLNLSQPEQLQLVDQSNQLFKAWSTLQPDQKENIDMDKILKQVIQLTENSEKLVRYRALTATLYGVQVAGIKSIFLTTKDLPKPPIRRPKSGRKNEILPSIVYTPQQIITVLVKISQMTADQEFQVIIQGEQISLALCSLLSKLSVSAIVSFDKQKNYLQAVEAITTSLKNLSNQKQETKYLLATQSLNVLNSYFHCLEPFFDESNMSDIIQIYTIITAILRNLAAEQISLRKFTEVKLIQKLAMNLEIYPKHHELILNTLRIISKISVDENCCTIFMQNKRSLQNLSNFFKLYQNNIYVLIRVTFFLANLTTYFQEIREQIYFEFQSFPDITTCLESLIIECQKKELGGNKIDQFGITKSGWDFNTMKSETPQDCMIKVIRLIANLLTVERIGQDLISQNQPAYIDLLHKLKNLLKKLQYFKKEDHESISCVLNCLTNLLYYEKSMPISDFNYKNSKIEIIQTLGFFILQTENEDICCDGLRVVSNLSRQKDMIKHIFGNKLIEGLVVLLDTTSLEVAYYTIGVFLNLLQDEKFRNEKGQQIIEPMLSIVKDSTLEQREVVTLTLKCLSLISETKISQAQNQKIEAALLDYGNKCDEYLQKSNESTEVQNTRQIIHNIMNKLPDNCFECDYANCGRKFNSASELTLHKTRRHPK